MSARETLRLLLPGDRMIDSPAPQLAAESFIRPETRHYRTFLLSVGMRVLGA